MADRWSEATGRRARIVTMTRGLLALLLAALLALDLYALANTKPYDGGGDCGGKGCLVDKWHSPLVAAGVVLDVSTVAVIGWPWLVRRYRRQWRTE